MATLDQHEEQVACVTCRWLAHVENGTPRCAFLAPHLARWHDGEVSRPGLRSLASAGGCEEHEHYRTGVTVADLRAMREHEARSALAQLGVFV